MSYLKLNRCYFLLAMLTIRVRTRSHPSLRSSRTDLSFRAECSANPIAEGSGGMSARDLFEMVIRVMQEL
ncbi:hypothetical protein [Nostoc sp.]|uniref:hypothetical protein n=1 Tax=Nostoc sp. TaxID=1180 RepID=UPI002FF4DD92